LRSGCEAGIKTFAHSQIFLLSKGVTLYSCRFTFTSAGLYTVLQHTASERQLTSYLYSCTAIGYTTQYNTHH